MQKILSTVFFMTSLTSGFGKSLNWPDHLMRLKYFSNDFGFSIVALVLCQISERIQWNSLLMPWVVSEQEQRLWLSNGGREIPFIIISIILNLNPGPNPAHNQPETCFQIPKLCLKCIILKIRMEFKTLNSKHF